MLVNFYSTTDDPRKINKSLNAVKSNVNCKVYEDCNYQSPVLILAYDSAIIGANIMQIPEWNYYYKITGKTVRSGVEMIVNGNVDYLQTYGNALLECNATCVRNGGIGRPTYVPDNSYPLYSSAGYFTSLKLDEYFIMDYNTDNFLLTTK